MRHNGAREPIYRHDSVTELRPFHEITGFTLTLLVKVLRSENSEENSEESRLFTGANLVLRPALDGLCCQMSIEYTFWHYVYSKTFSFLRISENPSTQFLVKVSSVIKRICSAFS